MQTFISFQLVIIINLKPSRSPFFPCFIESPCIRERDQSLSGQNYRYIQYFGCMFSLHSLWKKVISQHRSKIIIPSSTGGNNWLCLKSCFSVAKSYDQIRQTNPTQDCSWISDLTWVDRLQLTTNTTILHFKFLGAEQNPFTTNCECLAAKSVDKVQKGNKVCNFC